MKTLKKIPVTAKYVELIPDVLEKDVIYVSVEYSTASHLCLCGCGSRSVTPLGFNWWSITDDGKGITLKPSILNKNCPNNYHYIITNGIANVV
jgi:hypothetical protein